MLNQPTMKNILSVLLSLIINTVVGGVAFYLFFNYVFANLDSLTSIQRQGYQNDIMTCIGLSFVFFGLAYLIYYLIMAFVGRLLSDRVKSIIAAFLIIGLNAMTFGFSMHHYGHLLKLILIVFLSMDIPFLTAFLKRKI
jgi:hypothetical protein